MGYFISPSPGLQIIIGPTIYSINTSLAYHMMWLQQKSSKKHYLIDRPVKLTRIVGMARKTNTKHSAYRVFLNADDCCGCQMCTDVAHDIFAKPECPVREYLPRVLKRHVFGYSELKNLDEAIEICPCNSISKTPIEPHQDNKIPARDLAAKRSLPS